LGKLEERGAVGLRHLDEVLPAGHAASGHAASGSTSQKSATANAQTTAIARLMHLWVSFSEASLPRGMSLTSTTQTHEPSLRSIRTTGDRWIRSRASWRDSRLWTTGAMRPAPLQT
jgi:hypothetical protein